MAQASHRSRFSSSGLVRVLADLSLADGPASKLSFAERLGEWVDFPNALSLFAALNATASKPAADGRSESAAAHRAFGDVRNALRGAIASDTAGPARNTGIGLPAFALETAADEVADYAPYHRYYVARQRDITARIAPLRATVRATLQRRSASLARLAALDAVLEQAFAARERDLLAIVPVLLGRRFERLRDAHRDDEPAQSARPDGWLARFRGDLRATLLAELDVRLQPVAGLVAALDNDSTGKR